jgi:capsular polysaccharide export protein
MSLYAFGFSRRKLYFLRNFLRAQRGMDVKIRPLRRASDLPDDGTLYVWGMATPPGLIPPHQIIRVEDGFLRSAGLGAALAQPMSWVFDDEGLYFDASRPSKLETILNTITLDEAEQKAAEKLRARIVSANVSKYNLAQSAQAVFPEGRRIVLVPGQVEDDASIQWGADAIRTNIGLLKAVRAADPDAFVVYKPHPDVVAGLRATGQQEDQASQFADLILTEGDIVSLLPHVDAVHVMTSLSGFEALLRGVHVVCWGRPIYAGWGLTTDKAMISRRTRALSLDQLVHGSLIRYPAYLDPNGCPSSAAQTVETLVLLRTSQRQSGLGRVGRALLSVLTKLRTWLAR